MEKEQKKSGRGLKLTAILLGVFDVLLIAVLAVCFLMNPGKGQAGKEPMEVQLPEGFVENADTYWDMDADREYPSQATVSFEAVLSEPEVPPAEEANNSIYAGFIFPDSNTVELTDEMLAEKIIDQPTSQMAINEIYARHGYQFTKPENIDYFNSYEWYAAMEKVEDMDAVLGMFSDVERANVEKLQAFQNAEGWNREG